MSHTEQCLLPICPPRSPKGHRGSFFFFFFQVLGVLPRFSKSASTRRERNCVGFPGLGLSLLCPCFFFPKIFLRIFCLTSSGMCVYVCMCVPHVLGVWLPFPSLPPPLLRYTRSHLGKFGSFIVIQASEKRIAGNPSHLSIYYRFISPFSLKVKDDPHQSMMQKHLSIQCCPLDP